MALNASKKYTAEFKRQAVQLAERLENINEAAFKLKIHPANIRNWKKELTLQK